MKKLSDLREPKTTNLSEALRSDSVQKLRQLAKLGIISDEHFPLLIRAFGKGGVDDLNLAEKNAILRAFDGMMHHIVDNRQLFQKVKQGFKSSPQHEDTMFSESFRPKTHKEFGYDSGEYEDIVHDRLVKAGYNKTSDGQYKHKTTGKEVVIVRHDGKVHHTMVSEAAATFPDDKDEAKRKFSFPVLLILRRKAIRLFPDGRKVALYYADKLQRYFSVPSTGDIVSEDLIVEAAPESSPKTTGAGNTFQASPTGEHSTQVMAALKGIVANKEPCQVKFRNGSKLKVDMLTAHAILTVYGRLSNPENQVKFDKMLNKDNAGFMKILDFVHKHYISGGQ
jgi:hypothetical protein